MSAKKVDGQVGLEIISTSTKNARKAIGCGNTRFYELLNSGEIQSYTDGRSRKVIVASLRAYVARQLEAEASKKRRGWTDKATKARMSRKRAASPSGE
jgi:hypothetical protein